MINFYRLFYHFFYPLWHVDISTWQVNEPSNTRTTSDKERKQHSPYYLTRQIESLD